MFEDIRENITRKFRDIKIWVSSIPSSQTISDYQTTCYGLFFVYVYGVYEEIIRNIISATISEINSSSTNVGQCIYGLYPLVFSPEYDSLYNVGNEHKWERRWDIANKFLANPNINIPTDLFPTDGKNIRIRQLESLSKSFGITESVLPRQEIGWCIQEMVDKRNDIAHGNNLPKEIGRGYTRDDLLQRCENISEICLHICDLYARYIQEKEFIR